MLPRQRAQHERLSSGVLAPHRRVQLDQLVALDPKDDIAPRRGECQAHLVQPVTAADGAHRRQPEALLAVERAVIGERLDMGQHGETPG